MKTYCALIVLMPVLLLAGCRAENGLIKKAVFKGDDSIAVTFTAPVDAGVTSDLSNFLITEKPDPDIFLEVQSVTLTPDGKNMTIRFKESLNQNQPHVVTVKAMDSESQSGGLATFTVEKFYLGYLLSIMIGAMIIQNFVFSKYLGLCVFFGTSQKKSTAVGMGITFTVVIIFASLMSWFLYQFVLKPFRLDYLQIIVFIGLVSLTVQGVDTVLRKVNPALFKAFGVYLVLVIANCIVIAVPLILADNEYNMIESFMLALGAGLGFLIALFLMSSVRERLEFANVPASYRGLPIAFIVAGLFALSFMGFSGMSLF
ncbi:electron transport complex protein RnfA [Desulfosarcina sp.]|uniref:electron transport complex protein RnfA n=1 Tax=Desulfosarcina sp. TaxID=2027861 RepID=UPI0029A0894C|nr:Rnf-Nqr domain containing protein [Desulfosarcina sp.]MDX2454887.1 Rnf-Nqr domain containing protein [Desulfosarcina sp.]